MEKININVNQQNNPNQIFLLVSILSWLLISINNLASLKFLYREPYSVWNIYAYGLDFSGFSEKEDNDDDLGMNLGNLEKKDYPFPLKIGEQTIYKIFNSFFVITIIGCATLIYKTIIKKDQALIYAMFGKYSRFHFVPLLFGFIMSILGETNSYESLNADSIAYAGLPMSLLGLGCTILIYINFNIYHNDWLIDYIFHKGTYSFLIILFLYNFCYDIYPVRVFNKLEEKEMDEKESVLLLL